MEVHQRCAHRSHELQARHLPVVRIWPDIGMPETRESRVGFCKRKTAERYVVGAALRDGGYCC